MRYVVVVARILLGGAFVVFGLNTFLYAVFNKPFMPPPPPDQMPPDLNAFLEALNKTGYMQPLIGATQFLGGLLVLTGLQVPLGLIVLAPVIVNIVLLHHFIEPKGLVVAYVVLALELFLAYAYWPHFRGILTPFARQRWGKVGAEPVHSPPPSRMP